MVTSGITFDLSILRVTSVLLHRRNSTPLALRSWMVASNGLPLRSLAPSSMNSMPLPLPTTTIFAFGSAFRWLRTLPIARCASSRPLVRWYTALTGCGSWATVAQPASPATAVAATRLRIVAPINAMLDPPCVGTSCRIPGSRGCREREANGTRSVRATPPRRAAAAPMPCAGQWPVAGSCRLRRPASPPGGCARRAARREAAS